MRYGDGRAFRQALEERLKAGAGGDGARLLFDRKRVVFDRLLARLVETAPGRWLLKGGFALQLRFTGRARATRDIDIDWQSPDDELTEALLDAANHDVGDFFQFETERADIPEERLGGSRRFRIVASLAGRQFETFVLDAGFRVEALIRVETLTTSDLLAFADIQPVTVAAIPLAVQLAEKLHAYTRVYEGARVSTRSKDLVDIVLIAQFAHLDAAELRRAIETTFASRGAQQVPEALPPPPAVWRLPFRQLAEALGLPGDLAEAHTRAAALIDPVLGGGLAEAMWSPSVSAWTSPRTGLPFVRLGAAITTEDVRSLDDAR